MNLFELVQVAATAVFVFMVLVYAVSMKIKNAGIMDIAWGLGFIVVAKRLIFEVEAPVSLHRLVVILIYLWGARLAVHILIRAWGKKEDWRYAKWRKEWGKTHWWRSFLQINMLQGLLMLIISLPIYSATLSVTEGISLLAWFGFAVWAVGFYFESVGDYQLTQFLKRRRKGQIMHKGLWRYSRHPNYFGEISQWWGLWLIVIGQPYWQLAVLSPIVITFLLLRVSGISMLEKKYDKNKLYQLYKKRTSPLIPLPPKK